MTYTPHFHKLWPNYCFSTQQERDLYFFRDFWALGVLREVLPHTLVHENVAPPFPQGMEVVWCHTYASWPGYEFFSGKKNHFFLIDPPISRFAREIREPSTLRVSPKS